MPQSCVPFVKNGGQGGVPIHLIQVIINRSVHVLPKEVVHVGCLRFEVSDYMYVSFYKGKN